MKKTVFLEKRLPLYLLGLLLVVMLFTVFTQFRSYGLTTDEELQDNFTQSVVKWYATAGKNQEFMQYPHNIFMPEHGIIFNAGVALVENIVHNRWDTEAVLTGLMGVLGVVALAMCGFELGGWWFAFLAGLSLWLYPRYFGAIFNNTKDMPFATANTLLLWSVLILIKQWGDSKKYIRNSLLVAFFLGLAVATRVASVSWYAILGLLLIGWWFLHLRTSLKERRLIPVLEQQAIACGIICAGSFLTIIALWPYIFLNPLANLYNAIKVNANYPWNGSVLYQGKMQLAVDLPRTYAIVWLVIGSPLALILFALLGLLLFCILSAYKRKLDPQMTAVVLAFALPLALIVGFHSILYNAIRQILFLVPPLILLAVYGFMQLFTFLWRKRQRILLIALVLLTAFNYLWITGDMIALHPYEYVYFNPLVGGVPGAYGQYEMDYWNSCYKPASEWLAQNYQASVLTNRPTIKDNIFSFQYMAYLPANFHIVQKNPDFFIRVAPSSSSQTRPPYQLIHTVSVEGIPLCQVYAHESAP